MHGDNIVGHIMGINEVAVLLLSLGCEDLRGMSYGNIEEFTVESEAEAFNSLLHKNVLCWNENKYYINAPFDKVFKGMRDCERSVRLFSKCVPDRCWITYDLSDTLAAWEIRGSTPEKVCLYLMNVEDFIGKLENDGFIPDVYEYSHAIPLTFGDKIKKQVEDIICGDAEPDHSTVFLAISRDKDGTGDRKLVLSNGNAGSVITVINGEETVCYPYRKDRFQEEAVKMIKS